MPTELNFFVVIQIAHASAISDIDNRVPLVTYDAIFTRAVSHLGSGEVNQ